MPFLFFTTLGGGIILSAGERLKKYICFSKCMYNQGSVLQSGFKRRLQTFNLVQGQFSLANAQRFRCLKAPF